MVDREILPSGLTLLFENVPGVRSASVGVWLRMGSRHEPAHLSGICHFIEHLVFKGTATRSARDISLLTDRIGGNVDAFTTKEMTCFFARALDEHLPVAVDLLSDIVRRPAFQAEELERERKVILEEIRMVRDTPEEHVYDLFCRTFWPGHPLGRPIQGREETVRGMSRRTVLDWFRKAYVPPNMVIAAAGRLTPRRRDVIAKAFRDLEGAGTRKTDRAPRWSPGVKFERRHELEQVHLLFGAPALAAGDRRRFALHMLNTLLGGSLSSRLFQRIREERGLAYSVSSQVHGHVGAGLWTIYAATSPDTAGEVLRLSLAELRDLAAHAPTADEVDVARDHLKGNLLLALESTSSRMSRAAREEMVLGTCMTTREINERLDAVGARQIRELAEDLFSGVSVAFAAVGRTEKLRGRSKDLAL